MGRKGLGMTKEKKSRRQSILALIRMCQPGFSLLVLLAFWCQLFYPMNFLLTFRISLSSFLSKRIIYIIHIWFCKKNVSSSVEGNEKKMTGNEGSSRYFWQRRWVSSSFGNRGACRMTKLLKWMCRGATNSMPPNSDVSDEKRTAILYYIILYYTADRSRLFSLKRKFDLGNENQHTKSIKSW